MHAYMRVRVCVPACVLACLHACICVYNIYIKDILEVSGI